MAKTQIFYLFIFLRIENLTNVDKRHKKKKSLDLESNDLNLNPKSIIYQQYILGSVTYLSFPICKTEILLNSMDFFEDQI